MLLLYTAEVLSREPKRQDKSPVSSNFAPVTVTMVPPETLPEEGAMVSTATPSLNSKLAELASKSTPLLLTETATVPAAAVEGVAQVTSVELT